MLFSAIGYHWNRNVPYGWNRADLPDDFIIKSTLNDKDEMGSCETHKNIHKLIGKLYSPTSSYFSTWLK